MFGSIFQTFTVKNLSFVCQFYNFILGCTEIHTDVIIETTFGVSPVYLNFNTGVADFTHIQDWVVQAGRRWKCFRNQEFFGLIVIVVHGTGQFVVEETEVKTNILSICSFPFQRTILQPAGNTSCPCIITVTFYISLVFGVISRN